MKPIIFSLIIFCITLSQANNDRAIYIKKYASETKTALVIGNSNYNNSSLSKLKNPVNDARAVRDKLKEKNFDVLYLENGTQRQIDKIVKKFKSKLKNSGVGLFYFAGHGLEVDKKNYLIPIGANVADEMDVKYEALAVNEIVDRMKQSSTRLNIVVLDACRNNPFKRGAGGLAPMTNAKGTLIAYATDSGSTASDNVNESNGLFTKHFLKALDKPINQRELFHNIRKGVNDESNGRQLPYLNDGTIGDFFFTLSDAIYQKSNAKQLHSLTIKTSPKDAIVKITNIKQKYYNGMQLKEGQYDLKISKNGYITKYGKVVLKKDKHIYIILNETNKSYNNENKKVWNDKKSGLMWQKDINREEFTWNQARIYCNSLSLGQYSGWRMPSINELLTLGNIPLQKTNSQLSIEENGKILINWFSKNKNKGLPNKYSKTKVSFIKKELLFSMNFEYQTFWSSSIEALYEPWIVEFSMGVSDNSSLSKYDKAHVRCVRSNN